MDVESIEPPRKSFAIDLGIVNAVEHEILDHHLVALHGVAPCNGFSQLIERIAFGQRDDGFAGGLIGTVKTECEIDFGEPFGQAYHAVAHANGGNENPGRRTVEVIGRGQQVDGVGKVGLVVKGFAHSHEDNVVEAGLFGRENLSGLQNLIENFKRMQIFRDPHFAGRAEVACRRAADLAGDT